jgi:microsomal epoxide hydrolase
VCDSALVRDGVAPFAVSVADSELDDLRARLAATRWPEAVPGSGWDYGTDVDWLRALCEYWADRFDWRAQESVLNEWPQVLVRVGNRDVHCVHVPGVGPDPVPLVATHGWPSTSFEFHKVIGPLTDPARFGGVADDAFSLVVPSLPGFGFSDAPAEPGFGAAQVADVWVELMAALGYARFASHGGDWGSAVTTALGARHPERMIGLHLTMAAPPVDPAALTPAQRVWWDELQQYRDREWVTSISSARSRRRPRSRSPTRRSDSRRGSSRSGGGGATARTSTARAISCVPTRATSCSPPSPSTG